MPATTENDQPTTGTSVPPPPQTTEIGKWGKRFAGFLFIMATLGTLYFLIGLWPDRLPKDSGSPSYYRCDLFKMCLLDETCNCRLGDSDTTRVAGAVVPGPGKFCNNSIHLNTILMILVALAGFLGSLIHTASSFTNFVGANTYKKTWVLWYYVKPFTAAGLAMVLYFVFRAGLLSFNDPSNINLYGLVTLAALTGLFTDKATLKLKEFFEVVFRPKDERPDKVHEKAKLNSITPSDIEAGKENELVITGEKLLGKVFTVTINNEPVTSFITTDTAITIKYTIPATQANATNFVVSVKDENGDEIYSATVKLKP